MALQNLAPSIGLTELSESLSATCLWILSGLVIRSQFVPLRLASAIGKVLLAICLIITFVHLLSLHPFVKVVIDQQATSVGLWCLGMMLIGIPLIVRSNRKFTDTLLYILTLASVSFFASVLAHLYGYDPHGERLYRFQGYNRPSGLFASPLEAGLAGLIGWGLGGVLAMHASKGHWWMGYFLISLSTAVVYLSLSRSAWLGLAVATLIGIVFCPHTHRKALLPVWGCTIAVFLLCSIAIPSGWERAEYALQGDRSVHNRLESWKTFLSLVPSLPFGVPYNWEYAPEYNIYRGITLVNAYLDLWLYYGVLPFLLFLGVCAVLAWRSWRLVRRGSPYAGVGLASIATLICLLFMSPFWDILVCTLLGGLWGLVAGVEVSHEKPSLHAD